MSTKYIYSFILALILSQSTFAQRKLEQIAPEKEAEIKNEKQLEEINKNRTPKWYSKLNYGVSASMYFSNYGNQFSVEPIAIYPINEILSAGAGLSFYYYSLDNNTTSGKQTYSNFAFGTSAFCRLKVFDNIFAQAEYMPMNTSVYDFMTKTEQRQWVNSFLVGGGQIQSFTDHSGAYFIILYDLLHDVQRSFSPSPIHIRVGLFF